MKRILFVCTGNVFRSLTAELALRSSLGVQSDILVSSAGTEDSSAVVRPEVRDYLEEKGLSVDKHIRRTLTNEILEDTSLVIAMSSNHRNDLKTCFGVEAPIFTQACGAEATPLLDISEAVPDHDTNPDAVTSHIRKIIDEIVDSTPDLIRNLGDLFARYDLSLQAR